MNAQTYSYVYGPVPSRRLGRSLGIDLVPLKTCSYDCVYCQLGRTTDKTIDLCAFGDADDILREVERKLGSDPTPPDYIGLAGSGEPTLNTHIGAVIEGIKHMTDVPVAVLTNGSLLWMPEVSDALMAADVVLPSLDACDPALFARVNRPHPHLSFEQMVDGIASFTKRFAGEVWLEVLLLGHLTGIPSQVEKIATLAEAISPTRVQLNTVCRPPAERSALTVPPAELLALSSLFKAEVDIISHGDVETHGSAAIEDRSADVLALLQRRPCTVKDIADGLHLHMNDVLKQVDILVANDDVTTTRVEDRIYYAAAPVSLHDKDGGA